ncbi:MAG: CoA transferase [Alphaproteobacteria bacterium]|nr:CoA transferase [Alphaproteobacteria bacterium]
MTGILDGVRILDLTRFFAGPHTTLMLAGMGAEVIRIDNPATGDGLSDSPVYAGPNGASFERSGPDDLGIPFLKRCRGKKAITLDLKSAEGLDLFLRLVDRADVVVENFTVGVTERLGIDDPTLRARNPGLVYCSVTGFGSTGPDRHLRCYDVVAQAMSGLMSVTGLPGQPPTKAGSALADSIASVFALSGVLGALLHREKTGEGQHIDVSMVDCLFALLFDEPLDCYGQLGLDYQQGNRIPRFSPFNTYETKDGWMVIGVGNEAQWAGLLRVMDREDLLSDPDYIRPGWRVAHTERVDALVGAWTKTVDAADAVARLQAEGVVASPIHDIDDLKAWPHFQSRNMIVPLAHPTLGPLDGVGAANFPVRFSETPGQYKTPAAPSGSHNEEIYGELLGLQNADLDRLKKKGVI